MPESRVASNMAEGRKCAAIAAACACKPSAAAAGPVEGGAAGHARCGDPRAREVDPLAKTRPWTPRPRPMEDAMEQAVRTLQDRVNAALLGSDWQALDELVSPNAPIIAPEGVIITRDKWIGVHNESDYQPVRLETSETDVHTYDHAGIRFDVVDSECTCKGETVAGRFRVTQAWVTDHDKWQLAAVQYTSLSSRDFQRPQATTTQLQPSPTSRREHTCPPQRHHLPTPEHSAALWPASASSAASAEPTPSPPTPGLEHCRANSASTSPRTPARPASVPPARPSPPSH